MDSMGCVRKEESKVSSNIVACAGGRREGPLTEIVKGQDSMVSYTLSLWWEVNTQVEV